MKLLIYINPLCVLNILGLKKDFLLGTKTTFKIEQSNKANKGYNASWSQMFLSKTVFAIEQGIQIDR